MHDVTVCLVTRRDPLNRRLHHHPRDYLAIPELFGHDPTATVVIPDGGDERSCAVALAVHQLACRVRAARINGAAVARMWEFSRQTWSDVLLGKQWPSTVLFTALVCEVVRAPSHGSVKQFRLFGF